MLVLKVERYFDAMHHEATCRRLVEVVSQDVVNVRSVKGSL